MVALGIGANTAIFGVVDAVLWRPLPYPHADRLMALAEQRPREGRFTDRWPRPISSTGATTHNRSPRSPRMTTGALNLTGTGEPERSGFCARRRDFSTPWACSRRERDFRADEEVYGHHRIVLLTDALLAAPLRRRSARRRPQRHARRQRRMTSSASCRVRSGGRLIRMWSCRSRSTITIARFARRTSSTWSGACAPAHRRRRRARS